MSETKFTPGEWKAYLPASMNSYELKADDAEIALFWHELGLGGRNITKAEAQANIRLASAAPEMYEALRDILSAWHWDHSSTSIETKCPNLICQKAAAALAKARGKQ